MKKIIGYISFVAIVVTLFSACRNEDLAPQPEPEWAPVVTAEWTDMNKTFFNAADLSSAVFEYVLDGEDFDKPMAEVASIEVFLEFNDQDKQAFGVFDDLPVTISLSAAEAAGYFGMDAMDLEVGDKFTFSYAVNAVDGRSFDLYNNNICNLIRVIGICHLDAFVLTPAVAETSIDNADNAFSISEIAAGNDQFGFNLTTRAFANTAINDIDLELTYQDDSDMDYGWKTVKTIPYNPTTQSLSISSAEALNLFNLTAGDLAAGDKFVGRFVFNTPSGSCTTYGSGICGASFPSYIVFPQHKDVLGEIPDLSFANPRGTATAPPATSLSGTCSMEISITE